jgi:hypothetical protein
MNNLSFDKILKFFPSVYDWIEQQENEIFVTGRNLYLNEMKVAKEIGIKNYDIIKILETDSVPQPKNKMLLEIGKEMGLINSRTNGICFRYGIFIHQNLKDKNATLCHELIHTLQYERLGSIEAFIKKYLKECYDVGYRNSTLELEAIIKSKLYLPLQQ